MIDKRVNDVVEAVAPIGDGATVLISGFGEAGSPTQLTHALLDQGARDLTVVSNNAGFGHVALAALIEHGRIRRIICSFPRSSNSSVFNAAYAEGTIQVEVVPQGTLAERIRAGRVTYNKSTRNFGPVMCMAADCTIGQARQTGEAGHDRPRARRHARVFVDRVVQVASPAQESLLVRDEVRYP